jgi:hypothetical protein
LYAKAKTVQEWRTLLKQLTNQLGSYLHHMKTCLKNVFSATIPNEIVNIIQGKLMMTTT